ncbi:uroporphyrinogen decarboxylase [Ardenticatena maritima]|uniref:Uroporphyrinogen decarboxylase n=1 Tax=Ardenticatena maritima TaxID=872965 RepID=A0A0M8KAB8_9CHLR|nr:uroporphyrinogen decarboxylase [Ardenticatena maritima]KPL86960.1 uroporphyrinogen decarboxylase [Ardenticatena maritima]GAP63679.1 uroporphyrinogen decarboxylase [Ardenticatena maritima]
MNDRFLRACRRESVDTTPVWFMRQAGRFLPEYRALREKHPILEMIKTPELAVEVTLQPLRRFDLDAAIIFADILPLLETMGLELEFVKGEGPVIHNPIRTPDDVAALRVPDAEEIAPFTIEAIRLCRRELDGRVPLIGFSGAPFTLASYAIEGGSSRHYRLTKTFMYAQPQAWHSLMDKLAQVIGAYLQAQAAAGAQALQLFDSWVGALTPNDYAEYVQPYSRRVLDMARQTGVPVIHFSTGTAGMLEQIRATGGDVISIDWRIHLDDAWARIGYDRAIQGNLDPIALMAPWPELRRRAEDILRRAGGRPGHIFNLGHGILPQTPIDNVARLVDFVHEWRVVSPTHEREEQA